MRSIDDPDHELLLLFKQILFPRHFIEAESNHSIAVLHLIVLSDKHDKILFFLGSRQSRSTENQHKYKRVGRPVAQMDVRHRGAGLV